MCEDTNNNLPEVELNDWKEMQDPIPLGIKERLYNYIKSFRLFNLRVWEINK